MKYEILLFDADMTLLDFAAAEKEALQMTLREYKYPADDDTVALYSGINDSQWKLFEKGLCSKAELIVNRFKIFLGSLGFADDPAQMNAAYINNLANCHPLLPDAFDVCQKLSEQHRLFIITNGVARTQKKRFADCGLAPFFESCSISEEIGVQKPLIGFFDFVKANIPGFEPSKALVIGDSLTSDIQGGVNAGLDTCWFNQKAQQNTLGIPITYEISKLTQLYDIVK